MQNLNLKPFGNYLLLEPVPNDDGAPTGIYVPGDVRIARGRVLALPIIALKQLEAYAEQCGVKNPLTVGSLIVYRVKEKHQIRVGRNVLIRQTELVAYEAPREANV
jgi:hypothetical protein